VATRPREETPAPVVTIVGERIALGPLRRDLLATYQRWNNDFGVTRTMSVPRPRTLEQVAADFEHLNADDRSTGFTIYERDGWRPIGNVAWNDIDWRNGTAEYVLLIGEAERRGMGYGTEATRLMLDYAFTALGLHSVWLRVYAYNLGGLRAYAKAGFRECGRRRQAKRMGDRLWDVIYMDCMATEFTSPVLAQVFAPDEPRGERGNQRAPGQP
jgi:diamine N-acetyltransferase